MFQARDSRVGKVQRQERMLHLRGVSFYGEQDYEILVCEV